MYRWNGIVKTIKQSFRASVFRVQIAIWSPTFGIRRRKKMLLKSGFKFLLNKITFYEHTIEIYLGYSSVLMGDIWVSAPPSSQNNWIIIYHYHKQVLRIQFFKYPPGDSPLPKPNSGHASQVKLILGHICQSLQIKFIITVMRRKWDLLLYFDLCSKWTLIYKQLWSIKVHEAVEGEWRMKHVMLVS